MSIQEILKKLIKKQNLDPEEVEEVMGLIMRGETTPVQTASFLSLLASKGETVDEIAGMAKVMRDFSEKVEVDAPLLDNCGTGGSGLPRLNVSTACAFVLSATGVKVAKHGNRSAGGRCGGFDVLEALGANIELNKQQVEETINKLGLGFMFAPLYHPAMKHVAPVRKELGIRTVFNFLGPLSNPANVQYQVLGVSSEEMAPKMIEVLKKLGSKRVLLVYGMDGLDEVTVTNDTKVWELKDGEVYNYSINPVQFGMPLSSFSSIAGGNAQENAKTIKEILNGKITDARLNIVLLNVAVGLVAYEKVPDISSGIKLAHETIESGQALDKMKEYVEFSRIV